MSSDKPTPDANSGWALLRAGAGGVLGGLDIRTIPTVVSQSGPTRLALGAKGEARVLLPLADREASSAAFLAPSLRILESTYSRVGKTIRFLDITCMLKDLEAVFGEVVDEIFSRISAGRSCVDAAQSTLDDFRALLLPAGSSGLTTGIVAGLAGELLLLNRLLDTSPAAWRAWQGPKGDRHDFRSGTTSLEVKTSLKRGTSRVTINGATQLDANAGGTLHLLHLVLEVSFGGILSISALGRSALSRVDDPNALLALLAAVGCPDPGADEWNQVQFKLEDETLYEVADGFPRIVASTFVDAVLPAGVGDLQYAVDLSVATAFCRNSNVQRQIQNELSQCL